STLDVVVLGAGEMARLSAMHFSGHVQGMTVAARTHERAAALAQEVDAVVVEWTSRTGLLTSADVVIAATGADGLVLEAADLTPLRTARRGRPLFIVDLAVPRDVDP